jgi:DME family drug/metabolite transporter
VLGLVAALGSGSVYAATVAVAGPLAGQGSPVLVTTAASLIGAAALVPVAALSSAGIETGHRPSTLAGLAYLGALTMALAYGLFYAGLRTTPQSSAVIATLLEPVTAAIAAAAVLGERLGPGAVAGAVMILGSVVLLWLRDRAPEPMDV